MVTWRERGRSGAHGGVAPETEGGNACRLREPHHTLMTETFALTSSDRESWVRLTLVETEPVTDAVCVRVEAEVQDFAGAVPRVWMQRSALDAFAPALARFEAERSGSVEVVNSGSPDATNEFALTLEARSGGHARATALLRRLRYDRSGLAPLELLVRFDVDGGDLATLVQRWGALFAPRHA